MKLSIITVNLNNKAGLEKTLRSLSTQTFGDFESIVIDGGSTDGSYELTEAYLRIIGYRISEKDSGIYNDDAENPEQQTAGRLTESTMNWVLDQIEDAIGDGRRPIGMMHHGLAEHFSMEEEFLGDYLVNDYQNISAAFADAGIQIRSYADEGFRITVGTEEENALVLSVLKTYRRNA